MLRAHGFAAILLLLPLTGHAGTPAPLQRDDPRLAKRVTLRLKRTPLSEVTAEIRRPTGVTIAVAAPVADEPAIVYLADLPSGEVMRHLAEHFDYRWRRTGSAPRYRYELYQPRESAQREEALRARDRQRALEALQANIDASAQPAAGRRPAAREGDHALARLIKSVRAEQLAELFAGRTVSFSAPRQEGDLELPRELRHGFLAALQPRFSEQASAERRAEVLREVEAAIAKAKGLRADLWLDPHELGSNATAVRLTARVALVLAGEDRRTNHGSTRVGAMGMHRHPPPEPLGPEEAAARWGDDPMLGPRKASAADPAQLLPPGRARLGQTGVRLHEVLPVLAETYGVQLVADAYDAQDWPPAPPRQGVELALYQALDRFVLPCSDWRKEGEVVFVRDRLWYRDRLGEIPDRVARQWRDALLRARRVTIEEAVALSLSLRDEQLRRFTQVLKERGVHLGAGGLSFLGTPVTGMTEFLRAYGTLSPRQRLAVRGEEGLPAGDLPAPSREWLAAAVERAGRTQPWHARLHQRADGRFSLTVGEIEREVLGVEDGKVQFRWRHRDGPRQGQNHGGGFTRTDSAPPGFAEGGQIEQLVYFRYTGGEGAGTGAQLLLPWVYPDRAVLEQEAALEKKRRAPAGLG